MSYERSICWIRRDLRLSDHRALSEATKQSGEVLPVFVFDPNILGKLEDKDDKRVSFIAGCLEEIDRTLKSQGSGLAVCFGDPALEIPKLAREFRADAVFTNHDYEPSSKRRDERVREELAQMGVPLLTFKDQVVFERQEVLTQAGTPFRVFTPYKNAWLEKLTLSDIIDHRVNKSVFSRRAAQFSEAWSLQKIGFKESELIVKPGEEAGIARLKTFEKRMDAYAEERDFPAKAGTSSLSVDLRFGTISIRSCVRLALKKRNKGSEAWLSELIWRDFFHMILDQYPEVEQRAFREEYESIKWPGKASHFKAWCEGRTGYPIVDAAMRELNETGLMHNRLRMITATFLVKTLLVDWRKGEKWFARKLLDYDLASNNGNWQWCASTGCDAQPFFRIMNPLLQSEKFDEKGEYIRRWCPELSEYSDKRVHWPNDADMVEHLESGCELGKDYPKPLVFLNLQRYKALSLYEESSGR